VGFRSEYKAEESEDIHYGYALDLKAANINTERDSEESTNY